MSDINDATRYLDEDGLLTLADRIEDVYAKKTDVSKSIQATYEQSPTLAAHVADEYLYIKTGSSTHITYKTLTSIAANTELVVGTNVKVFDDTGIPVYVDKVPGAGGGGVQPILRTEYVGTSTRSDQTIDEDRIIYYINKFYKVVKNGGLPASYTVVPATDLETVSLGTDILVSVERMPAGAVITAADVVYDDGTVDDALTELNSNKSKVLLYTGYATFHDAWNLRKTFDVQPGYLGAVCNQGSLVPKTGSYQLASEAIGDSQISVTLFAQDAPFQSGDSVLVCIMVLYP